MLEVYTKNRQLIAILQNAIIQNNEINLNGIDFLDFSLPSNDFKNQYCEYYNLIKFNNVVYRIVGKDEESDPDLTTYKCEHIIAKLLDDVMFGTVLMGGRGMYTNEVIEYVLKDTDFVLDKCEFARQFEYGWEQENKLKALFDIPNRFVEHYQFIFDTSTYPYKVSLIKLDETKKPKHTIQYKKNLLRLTTANSTEQICTKLYCLGAGEGINQLNIKSLNNGVPYLLADEENIKKYGIVERVFVDRRFKKEESLLEFGKKLIAELQNPYVEYEVDYAQVYREEENPIQVGDIVEIIKGSESIKRVVTKITISENATKTPTINIANKPQDVAGSIADLADRQRIEQTYAQGATQLYAQSLQGNASPQNGLILDFFVPEQASIINSIRLKTRMSQFRAYSKATAGGGASSTTSSAGGGGAVTSSNGGSVSTTSASGGGVTTTTGESKIDFSKWGRLEFGPTQTYSADGSMGSHTHGLAKGWIDFSNVTEFRTDHQHTFTVPAHSHSFKLPAHNHSFSMPAHTHQFNIPSHTHDIQPGIYFFGSPTYFDIYVNGTKIKTVNDSQDEIDITNYLINNDDGRIPRGQWLEIEIRPNDLAYINISLAFQGYIQSRGEFTV